MMTFSTSGFLSESYRFGLGQVLKKASRVEPDQITADAERWVGVTRVEPST
jgi:hypothetical protein